MNFYKTRIFTCAGLLIASFALQADNPTYLPESTQLRIPSIDLQQQQGAYQDVLLEFMEGDLWRLKEVSHGEDIRGISNVRVIKTSSFPVQVFLEIEGSISGLGCRNTQISQRRVGDVFEVSIQQAYSIPEVRFCAAFTSSFSWIVPLPVYGLAAAEYQYSVNGGMRYSALPDESESADGELSGSFVIEADNILERAAPEYPYAIPAPVSNLK